MKILIVLGIILFAFIVCVINDIIKENSRGEVEAEENMELFWLFIIAFIISFFGLYSIGG